MNEGDYAGILGQDRKQGVLADDAIEATGLFRRYLTTPEHLAAEADERQMCFDAAESEYEDALEASEQNGAEGDSPERRETKKVEWRYKFCD